MTFWFRELIGWLLLIISLGMFALSFMFAMQRAILELWPCMIGSIFVFRGAIHLLKVAVAARMCRRAQDQLYANTPPQHSRHGEKRGEAVRAGLALTRQTAKD